MKDKDNLAPLATSPCQMSILSWNCRRAGNAMTVQEARKIALKFSPSFLCLVQTWINKARVEGLTGTLAYDNDYAIGSSGRSGGNSVFWNNEINLTVLGSSKYHIDFSVQGLGPVP